MVPLADRDSLRRRRFSSRWLRNRDSQSRFEEVFRIAKMLSAARLFAARCESRKRGTFVNGAGYGAIGLAIVGLYIASYFTLVYYGLIGANTKLMPRVCQLEERTCQTVLGTRFARVFGVPNSLLGVFYYIAVVTIVLNGWNAAPVGIALVVVAWFTVALGLFLAYSLFFIIKIPCPLCLAGHAINLTVAILLSFPHR